MTTMDDRLSPARAFVETVCKWQETDKGRLAALRRSAGDSVAGALEQGAGIAWFFDTLNRFAAAYGEENVFLVGTLLAFDRRTLDGGAPYRGSFGSTMAAMRPANPSAGDPIERRFAILLDADFDHQGGGGELPFRLRQTVKLALSKDAKIDWPQLLYDLRGWADPAKIVQKQWARDFYAQPATDSPDPKTPATPAAN